MRTTADRIRHTIGFEVIGLIAFAPLASWVFGYELHQMGIVGAVAALIAATWNYIYNILFDHAMLRFTGQLKKSTAIRVLHAILFEGGLLIVFLPSVAWYLKIGLVEAFIMDIAVAGYYMVYAFFYNWAYDVIFPIPNATPSAPDCQSAN
ncbi:MULTISPECIES: PACE efflux transporter [unclassified Cupriavidus]|uniref:PACE efflux transporter n=1 Tax=unclassified Cupriavidus TaxID=2640874 RepID=UPI001BFFDBC5|nr:MULTISPECIES: PACE efflux transporter [unclassified Cupriavidus]MCA3186197.1 PACE efflux transporter [Cupriavidus sp.]MCA3192598.1 PACE efflux transporter [Cupriavidus sp.]MCA3200029.1 PACE efflux transporter [Cupriavidus sp.]MCA3203448.1 PACE efflux transporter [Cupriavidus sp.]MCA3207439.1 PACE efflux transporter [Cupriavidus sp.]